MKKYKYLYYGPISLAIMILTLCLFVLTLYQTSNLEKEFITQTKLEGDLNRIESTIYLFEHSTAYLSEQATYYAVTLNMDYFQNYWNERNIQQSRDIALERFSAIEFSKDEILLLNEINKNYQKLTTIELHALKLIATALTIHDSKLPPQLKDYKLSTEEVLLPRSEKLTLANSLLFGLEYANLRDSTNESVHMFNDAIRYRVQNELRLATEETKLSLLKQRSYLFLSVFLVLIFSIITAVLVVFPILGYLKGLKNNKQLIPHGSYELRKLTAAFNEKYKALGLSESRFRLAASKLNQILLDYDLNHNQIQILAGHLLRESVFQTLHLAPSEKWYSLIHPDDFYKMRQIKEQFNSSHTDSETILRVKSLKDSTYEYTWFRATFSELIQEGGSQSHILIVLEDIDDNYRESLGLRYQANHDLLTHLLNRTAFQIALGNDLEMMNETSSAALLVLDLDDFKNVNDSGGHAFGDLALQKLSSSLKNVFRDSDLIGRLGGDEFIIWMNPVSKDPVIIERKVKELNRLLKLPDQNSDSQVSLSSSVGITYYKKDDTFHELYTRADRALYKAKEAGKGQACIEY